MPHHIQGKDDLDTALTSLSFYLRLQGIPADPEHLRHEFAPDGNPMDADTLCRAANHLGIKTRKHQAKIDDLNKLPLPAIALHNDGHWFLLAACRDGQVLIQDPLEQRPLSLPAEVFTPGWSGHLILLKHQGKNDDNTRFSIRWFIPALIKYRHLFAEVFIASFFIQSLALVTPLFFQVVIDKVLVHKGLTTLDVLAIGLLLVSLFEVVLGGLRTYLFSHG
jgi:ATP-binding cassette, subfamily B, bacterial HlyB/CyaB